MTDPTIKRKPSRVNSHNTFAEPPTQTFLAVTLRGRLTFARQLLIKWFVLSLNFDKEQSPDSLVKHAKLLSNYLP